MRLFKSIAAAALAACLSIAMVAPAAAIPLWSSTIGDVNFPNLTPNANVVTAPTQTKIAGGEATFTGTGTVATGLTTVSGCVVTIKVGTAPALGTSVVTFTRTSATLNLFAWKPTAADDATLIAADAAATVGWVCTGT